MDAITLARHATPRPLKLVLRRLLRVLRLLPPVPAPIKAVLGLHRKRHIDLGDTASVRNFVARSDELGGPNAPSTIAWWGTLVCDIPRAMRYKAERLDPLSADYFALQNRLYQTITGAPYRETISELTSFDKEAAAVGHLAYPNRAPETLNQHFGAMARMVEQFSRPGPLRILEAGSGWGFSAEYLARLGHQVVGVEINPDFVETATRRSRRLGLDIDYRLGTFEQLPGGSDERFDVIFTSGAFHHSRAPAAALRGMVARLSPDGQIILASEPFTPPDPWPAWGLRTDPLPVYCIAKFGWWESGWTREFMASLFAQLGLVMRFVDHHSELERYMIGTRA
jgi:SAM-dependent methyltransferase